METVKALKDALGYTCLSRYVETADKTGAVKNSTAAMCSLCKRDQTGKMLVRIRMSSREHMGPYLPMPISVST